MLSISDHAQKNVALAFFAHHLKPNYSEFPNKRADQNKRVLKHVLKAYFF